MTNWPDVVREYGPVVWRTAYRLLTNETDAADCFQRTFLAAVELETAGHDPVRHWAGLLKRIATARALEQLRARHRAVARLVRLPDQLPADSTAPDPVSLATGGELAEALRLALAAIDSQQAEVFCLVCLEGLTNRDAASHLGVTPNHVGVLLHRPGRPAGEARPFRPHRVSVPEGHL